MRKRVPKKAAKAPGRPRLVNQVLVNRMVALREQGFSLREIAQKVGRSERTARRYTKGVSPRVELPTQPKRVNVLTACGQLILYWRKHLDLDTEEVDAVLKELRKALDRKDPLTLEWFATDERARGDFLLHEFLRKVMPGINTLRHFRRIKEQLGACGYQVFDEEPPEDPGPSAQGLLTP
jgi:transcriptional regulator with XRE-family HTH domain